MLEVKTYSITEANNKGVSGVVKDSEREGIVLLKRNQIPVAIVIPLSISGMMKFINGIENIMKNDASNIPIELGEYAREVYKFTQIVRLQLDKFKPSET